METGPESLRARRWAVIRDILNRALELPSDERAAFLDRECPPEAGLRAEIDGLIGASERSAFFDRPVGEETVADEPGRTGQFGSGQVISHYRIEAKIGEGGMGAVYRAIDLQLDRMVALKMLSRERVTQEDKRRFAREARAASALTHPNIVTIYEYGSAGSVDFIAMELVEGTPLDRMIAERRQEGGRLRVGEAIEYARQIAAALAKAHAAGIIHRDLKPGNIIIDADGQAKVLDFGLAKSLAAGEEGGAEASTQTGLTTPGMVIGTPAYMSPEQALGEAADARSDIFSFGAILYECVTGKRAFQGSSVMGTLRQVLHAEPPAAKTLCPELPDAVAELIGRCLRKEAAERPQTLREVEAVLRAAGAPVDGRGRRAMLAAGVLAGLTVAGAAGWWKFGPRAETAEPRTSHEYFQRGAALLERADRKGNIGKAIEAFQKAVELDGENAAALAGLAQAYLARNNSTPDAQWVRAARESAAAGLARNAELGIVQMASAQTQAAEGNAAGAEAAARRAVELDPRGGAPHRVLGEILFARQDRAGAEREFRLAMELAPKDWRGAYWLGRVPYFDGRYGEAAEAWRAGLRVTPDNEVLHRNLAGALHMLGDYEGAAAELQAALTIEPAATTYSNLGTIRFFQGRYLDAVAPFEKAVELGAGVYRFWANLADAYRWAPGMRAKSGGAYETAIRLVRGELEKKPDDPTMRSQLALYLAKTGRNGDARAELQKLKTPARTPAALHFRLAVTRELLGERAAALTALEAAAKAGYAAGEIEREPELAGLRGDKRYQLLLSSLQKQAGR